MEGESESHGERPRKALKIFGVDVTQRAVDEDVESKSNGSDSVSENTRKLECKFCLREFGNSQALGGHQNAHKRERQHARRATRNAATPRTLTTPPLGTNLYQLASPHSARITGHYLPAASPLNSSLQISGYQQLQPPVMNGKLQGCAGEPVRPAAIGPSWIYVGEPARTHVYSSSAALPAEELSKGAEGYCEAVVGGLEVGFELQAGFHQPGTRSPCGGDETGLNLDLVLGRAAE